MGFTFFYHSNSFNLNDGASFIQNQMRKKKICTHTHNIFLKTGIITRKLGLVKVSKYLLSASQKSSYAPTPLF